MKPSKLTRFRCEHCKKFLHETDGHYTLEGIVSPGIDINFSICGKCFERQGLESSYWDKWVQKQQEAP